MREGTTRIHVSQSIRGPLMWWTKRDWQKATKWITRSDGTRFSTGDQLKEEFLNELAQGHEVIPMTSEPCEGFDYKTGCPGHAV